MKVRITFMKKLEIIILALLRLCMPYLEWLIVNSGMESI